MTYKSVARNIEILLVLHLSCHTQPHSFRTSQTPLFSLQFNCKKMCIGKISLDILPRVATAPSISKLGKVALKYLIEGKYGGLHPPPTSPKTVSAKRWNNGLFNVLFRRFFRNQSLFPRPTSSF